MRHGCGKNQGDLNYDGEWVYDKPHGNGLLKEGKTEYIGQFVKGALDESLEVTIRYENGSMFKGMTEKKQPYGRGFLVDENGILTDGIFKEGKLEKKLIEEIEEEEEAKEK